MKVFAAIGWATCLTVGMIGIHGAQLRDNQIREKEAYIQELEASLLERTNEVVASTAELRTFEHAPVELEGIWYHITELVYERGEIEYEVRRRKAEWVLLADAGRAGRVHTFFDEDHGEIRAVDDGEQVRIENERGDVLYYFDAGSTQYALSRQSMTTEEGNEDVIRKVLVKAGLVPAC